MPRTQDGHMFSNIEGVTAGLETDSVAPSSPEIQDSYDVIVIGSGFAGLTAARDLTRDKDLKVLLLEGRDRIGGRTWTAKAWGETFEMGGNWVHWCQPHVYAEASRHGLHKALRTTSGATNADTLLYKPKGKPVQTLNLAESQERLETNATAFFSVDGMSAQELMPYPHEPLRQPLQPWWKYDHLSVRDRLDQMIISENDKDELEAHFVSFGSGTGSDTAFTAALEWYALSGYSMEATYAAAGTFKFGQGGMTNFARHILHEYHGDRVFGIKVVKIQQSDSQAAVICESGRAIAAKRVVCTIPLNCLKDIAFDPPLTALRQEAIEVGHMNRGAKIHYHLEETKPGWGVQTPDNVKSDLIWAFADHTGTKDSGPDGTYCMGFGCNGKLIDPTKSGEIKDALLKLKPDVTVDRYLTHGWATDPFAQGAWYCASPGTTSKYLEELQKPHGRVVMASADWADGWRGFVDGAVEQGVRAAVKVAKDLAAESNASGTVRL